MRRKNLNQCWMKYIVLKLLLTLLSLNVAAQTPAESAEWINSQGEEYIKEITGNTSIHWELDPYGTLKITNNSPRKDYSGKDIIRKYSFFNLREFEPIKLMEDRLVFKCLDSKYKCIKSRNFFGRAEFKASETAILYFDLVNEKKKGKAKKIVLALNNVLKELQEK